MLYYMYIINQPHNHLIMFKIYWNLFHKYFKSVFKSWQLEKHWSKKYFKITTINYILFCILDLNWLILKTYFYMKYIGKTGCFLILLSTVCNYVMNHFIAWCIEWKYTTLSRKCCFALIVDVVVYGSNFKIFLGPMFF
jgi:hypothetical protein